MNLLVSLLLLTLILSVRSANILGIFPLPVRSHFLMFDRLMKGLAEKGHNVDVVSPFPPKEPPPRYNTIDVSKSLPTLTSNLSLSIVNDFTFSEIIRFMVVTNGVEICKTVLETNELTELRKTKKKYDLIITELFGNDCMYGFGHLFNIPTISMTSSVSLPWGDGRIGNPDNTAYIPTYYTTSTAKMDLIERITNTINHHFATIGYYLWSTIEAEQLSSEFYGPNFPTMTELSRNTSLIFINSHFSFSYARPTVPNFVEVGGLHINEPKGLSQHFQNILKTDYKGVIYLTMGSMIMTETFDFNKLQGMFDAFAELPYKVLWKGVESKFPQGLRIPSNVHFESWMPQTEILCHPNVKLFVSHGGLMGTQESIYCGVPVLGIPLFADQIHNLYNFEKLGMAIMLQYKDIEKETVLDAATKLLTVPSYRNTAKRISNEFKDRPMSPLDTAIYWTEYVIRHKGAPQLRTVGADLPWYQYYLLDVYGILFFVSLMFLVFIVSLIKSIFSFIYGPAKTKSD